MLYKATRDSFNLNQFHKKCNYQPNTLTIVETTKQKIIGGFTSLVWGWPSEGSFGHEQVLVSFIFQLNNNEKLYLKPEKAQQAIFRVSSYGPIFGSGSDLLISNNANKNNSRTINMETLILLKKYYLCREDIFIMY